MAMMERLLLQVLDMKKSIVDQVKHQTRLFDQHLASTLRIDGIEPPDWLLRSQTAEYKREEIILDLFRRPSQFSIPNSSCCRSVHEEALVNNEQCMVASCDDLGIMMDTSNGCRKLSVLPEDTANCTSDEHDGPYSTEFMVLSPDIQNMVGTGKSHHDLELSLASLQRSKMRQRALKLRNSASQSRSRAEINENFEGNRIAATFGIVKCCEDAQLDQAEDRGEVPVITCERIPISEMPSEKTIYVDEHDVRSLFRNSGVDMPPTKSLAGSDCTLGEVSDIHAEVNGVIEVNVGDAGIKDVRSNDCSEKVLRSQRSTCFSDVDGVIKFDDSFYGEKGKNCNEYTPQPSSVDHLQEADEKCGVDQTENEVCQENGHESASGSLMESRRFSCVAVSNKIVDMNNSSNIRELLVEGSVGQVSKASKPLVGSGCQSVEARSVTFSQRVSATADNKHNFHGCDTDLDIYVGDSGGGSAPSMNPAKVVFLGNLEMDADHLTEKDMEVLVPSTSSISHSNMLLEPKQLKFDNLGESMVSLNVASTMISEKAIHSRSPLRQTSLKHQDHKNDEKFGQVYCEDGLIGTIQLDTLSGLIVESSCPRKLEEQCGNPPSDGGESPNVVIGGLSSNGFDDGKKTSLRKQEQPYDEEQKQANYLCSEEEHEADIEPDLQESDVFLHRMFDSSSSQFSVLFAEDQNNPMLEGFVILTDGDQSCISEDGFIFKMKAVENATMQSGRNLELLGKSSSLNTPLQQLFIGNTDNQVSRLYQSVPNGLLEPMDLRTSLALNDGEQVDRAVDGRSYSDCLPYGEAASTRNNRKSYASPVGKLWEIVHASSGSSKHKGSLIPELPCISEEIEFVDEADDGFNENFSVEMASAKIEALADISEDPNLTVFNNDNEMARCSVDSTMIEATFLTANERQKEKHKHQQSRKRDFARNIKISKTFEIGPNGVKSAVKSPKNKLTHPKTCLEDGGSGISRKKFKNNIVSSMTSFLPFVQQKQVAAPCAGKRNVKVKALEAAETAKRQAEKKEIERKLKKEALKLERERVEKENMIRLKLEKKRKVEEWKKKEAEMTLKKRLREEEVKREKEKKRRHIKEPRKNIVDRQETSRSGKELPETKDLDKDAILTEKKEFQVDSGKQVVDDDDRQIGSLNNLSQTTSGLVGTESLTVEHDLSEDNGNLEPSYDISPYKCTDDEDEEEDDDTPDDKFIPSWAWKGSIAKDVFSQQNLDPDVIFPPDSFCSISEVVLPLKYQLKLCAGAGVFR